MKQLWLILVGAMISCYVQANGRDSTVHYQLPDSVKAIQFMAEINVVSLSAVKEARVGIQTDVVRLYLDADRDEKEIIFEFPRTANVLVAGMSTDAEKGEMEFEYDWSLNETYKLLIATAADSAGNFSLYSGYIFLPKENKWKLVGTCRIGGRWNTLQQPSSFSSWSKKSSIQANVGQVWFQRNSGSWKFMSARTPSEKHESPAPPLVNLFAHVDSIAQRQADIKLIEESIAAGKTDATKSFEGIYYTIIKEGTGRQVAVTDTVVAHYKGYLFSDGLVFDQTKENPATFPLRRLIRGWQIGLPLLKVGGKIKLVIPSDLAYSIRTRAAKIPPNSILVFEIEVVDAKN